MGSFVFKGKKKKKKRVMQMMFDNTFKQSYYNYYTVLRCFRIWLLEGSITC